MRILLLQMKRIGDLVLTGPAIADLRRRYPDAHLTLAVSESVRGLLPAFAEMNETLVFGKNAGASWWRIATGRWDATLDFTGNDRSALLAALSKARHRIGFTWMRKNRLRRLVYNRFVDSPVREAHTVDHYLHLLEGLDSHPSHRASALPPTGFALQIPAVSEAAVTKLLAEQGVVGPYAVVHPGSARKEKYWLPDRWATVICHLRSAGLAVALTGGNDSFERAHLAEIVARVQDDPAGSSPVPLLQFAGALDLLQLAALVRGARLVLSCDTAVVHLAAAFQVPQIALFGPTNPFHWRPRHANSVVLSAVQPEEPLTDFQPRMKGAPMDHLSTEGVIHATDSLLRPFHASSSFSISS